MVVERFQEKHIKPAIALFRRKFESQAAEAPSMDTDLINSPELEEMLLSSIHGSDGVALAEDGKLLGYMTGFYSDAFFGPHKGVYIPEWGHATVMTEHDRTKPTSGTNPDTERIPANTPSLLHANNEFKLNRMLYAYGCGEWVKHGMLNHAITILESDREAQSAFLWNGFGYQVMDAVRDVKELGCATVDGISIVPVNEDMIPVWSPMAIELGEHIHRAPAFKPDCSIPDERELAEFLRTEGNFAWIAFSNEEPAGFVKVTSIEDGAAWIAGGRKHFAVNGAYVDPRFRGSGIASLLLDGMMKWAKGKGFTRCSVDFETANVQACNFWLRYFRPVAVSMLRRNDPRILDLDYEKINLQDSTS